jgi:transposase
MGLNEKPYTEQLIKAIMAFLQMFMCVTLAKRITSMILLATGFPNERITELTGLCDKSVRTLKKSIETGEYENLFHVGSSGQKGKLSDIETSIIKEINENDYHSQQQIADMVLEKFGMKVSQPTISRLLKKRHQTA